MEFWRRPTRTSILEKVKNSKKREIMQVQQNVVQTIEYKMVWAFPKLERKALFQKSFQNAIRKEDEGGTDQE